MTRGSVVVMRSCITDGCTAAPVRQKRNWRLTQPPASLERLGPQAFYSSFSQWPFSQVMPDQA